MCLSCLSFATLAAKSTWVPPTVRRHFIRAYVCCIAVVAKALLSARWGHRSPLILLLTVSRGGWSRTSTPGQRRSQAGVEALEVGPPTQHCDLISEKVPHMLRDVSLSFP